VMLGVFYSCDMFCPQHKFCLAKVISYTNKRVV
jgi:hypothetical protein